MPAASRDQVLLWLATGDPILVAEARSKLAPLPLRPEAPKTLPELLGRIREDPSYPALAASGLAAALQDQKILFGSTCAAVRRRGGASWSPTGSWWPTSRRRGRRLGTPGRSSWLWCVKKNDDVSLFQKERPGPIVRAGHGDTATIGDFTRDLGLMSLHYPEKPSTGSRKTPEK